MRTRNKHRALGLFLAIFAAVFLAACQRSENANDTPRGLVVVNAPVSGKIRRVLISEGSHIAQNGGIVEISVPSSVPQTANDDSQAQARQSAQNAQAAMRAAEEELERAAIEVQRIEPLVAANTAPQSHLDAARAQFQQTQERLDKARQQAQNAQTSFAAQSGGETGLSQVKTENIVTVRASAAGNVRVISVRTGQTIESGQPVATISTTR